MDSSLPFLVLILESTGILFTLLYVMYRVGRHTDKVDSMENRLSKVESVEEVVAKVASVEKGLEQVVEDLDGHMEDGKEVVKFVISHGVKQEANEKRLDRLERKTGINGEKH